MIADHENPAEKVFLDGKPVDLTITTMADDERGIVEQFVLETDERGVRKVATGPMGQPKTVELRGEVRIFFPELPRKPN